MNCTVRRRPIRKSNPFFAPHFGNILNEFMNTPVQKIAKNASGRYSTPLANVVQTEDAFILSIALPSYTKKEVQITVENDTLTISGNRTEEATNDNFRLREFNYGAFKRAFRLPKDIDRENIKAKFDSGILKLTLVKREETKPKQITIK